MTTDLRKRLRPVTPDDFERAMTRPPVLSASGRDWDRITLQRFHVPHFSVRLGPSSVHRVTLHVAGHVEIMRVLAGRPERKWSEGGCTNFIPVGGSTTRSFQGDADFVVAYIAPSLVEEVFTEVYEREAAGVRLFETFAVKDPAMEQLGRLLLGQMAASQPGQRLFNDTLSRALVLHLLRSCAERVPPVPAMNGKLASWRVNRVVDYMRANLAGKASLSQLASLVGLGPVQFARAFRATTAVPPHAYLIRLRVEQAAHLLRTTSLSMTEIGLRCGFDHPSHFATTFRTRMGLSPTAYRARHY